MKKPEYQNRNKRGASLAEMLVTVLILSIAMTAVAGGASSSVRIYRQLRQKANAQTLLSTQINTLSGYLYDSTVETEDLETTQDSQQQKVKSLYLENYGYFTFMNKAEADSGQFGIYQKQASARDELENVGATPTITGASQPLKLYADLAEGAIYFSNGCYHFTVEVRSQDDQNNVIESQEVWIRSELMP